MGLSRPVDTRTITRRNKMGRPLNLHRLGNVKDIAAKTQIKVQAFVNGSVQDAYLHQQKNGNTFVVTTLADVVLPLNATNSAVCKFVNSATPVAGQMSVVATNNASGTFYVSRLTNRFAYDFSTPVTKYKWAFALTADVALLDHATILNVSIPSAAKSATPGAGS